VTPPIVGNLHVKKMPKKKISVKDVYAAESEHIGWLSEKKYYLEFINCIVKHSKKSVYVHAPVMFASKALNSNVRKNVYFDIVQGYPNLRKQICNADEEMTKANFIVYPIGNFYKKTTADIHWNMFVYEKKTSKLTCFDPGMCENSVCYAYPKAISNNLISFLTTKDKAVTLNRFITRRLIQKDSIGIDNFCQTWCLFFLDMYLNNKPSDLELFKSYDFLFSGKPLLKAWLVCMYKRLNHGNAQTWHQYVQTFFPGLFYYIEVKNNKEVVKPVKAYKVPSMNMCSSVLSV
jgi:hypothetical protein